MNTESEGLATEWCHHRQSARQNGRRLLVLAEQVCFPKWAQLRHRGNTVKKRKKRPFYMCVQANWPSTRVMRGNAPSCGRRASFDHRNRSACGRNDAYLRGTERGREEKRERERGEKKKRGGSAGCKYNAHQSSFVRDIADHKAKSERDAI